MKHSLFTAFSLFLKMSEVCNNSSKCWLPNKSANKIFYTWHLMLLLCYEKNICNLHHRTESYRNIHFLTRFYHFSQWIRCAIFRVNTDLLVKYQNINSSTQETLYLSFILKKIRKNGSVSCKRFSKLATFPHFPLVLMVRKICNKYWLLAKSEKEIFLQKTSYTLPSFHNKLRSPSQQKLLETSTFYHIFTNFHGGWGVQYFE